ncbi:putative phospholipid hydroperoxide glutathione peroxidase [Apium graveolens]|uniref:putative phospholipid hydroperoxide glutathione peroxidase n=1 Tax=Apium graveolens TaxID=4045 RepID=UPI003D7A2630
MSIGLEILAFPCNQFNGQEPGSNEEIENFVCTRFKAEYPILSKVDVNGSDAAPFYKYLKSVKGDEIEWNFAKFLVDKDGKLVERYAPTTTPLTFENDIKKVLGVA